MRGIAMFSAGALCASLVVLAASAAEAGRIGRLHEDLSSGYVTAKSRFGNGSVSGPVRYTSVGPQVRLPGGTWEHCRRSCAETLRVESIDFWESRDLHGGPQGECGIFGCLEIGRRY
ncbi:MAG: hypothetical protein NW217_16670 [Hyphomicrobiaceae bacterium]|nr:hypothetical protein [Hyphomicrobiaceae bacterium]